MKRNYTALEYRSIIRRLRVARPHISISSDFIIGFPGETDADFEQTMKLIAGRALRRLVQLHLQPASGDAGREPRGSDAARGEAREAAAAPAGAHPGVFGEYSRAMVGSRQRVLAEGISRKNADELCAARRTTGS